MPQRKNFGMAESKRHWKPVNIDPRSFATIFKSTSSRKNEWRCSLALIEMMQGWFVVRGP